MDQSRSPRIFGGDDSLPHEKLICMPLRILAGCVPIEENCPSCKRPVFAGHGVPGAVERKTGLSSA